MTHSSVSPWLAYYGDDFTGSTDVMEVLQWFGLRTVLFMAPPTPEDLKRYSNLSAIGVAGTSRNMSTDEMRKSLPSIFEALRRLGPAIVHYKTCSTFDSSPTIGSIGTAIEIAQQVFGSASVPVVVGAPHLGRYQAFGNLFARSGPGSEPYRLDRHPTMSQHPTTPMHEADLRRVLAEQSTVPVSLMDVIELESQSTTKLAEVLDAHVGRAVLIDAINESHLQRIGQLLHNATHDQPTRFMVGSSGVEAALTRAWPSRYPPPNNSSMLALSPSPIDTPMLVISGSCSPVSQRQLEAAERNGFVSIAIETDQLVNANQCESAIDRAVVDSLRSLRAGQNVILHTSRGPDDSRIATTRSALKQLGMSDMDIRLRSSRLIGPRLGEIVSRVIHDFPIQRVGIAGGDSSGYIVQQLKIICLEAIAPVTPGAPLCRASGPPGIDGLELILKGGQVGPDDMWVQACFNRG